MRIFLESGTRPIRRDTSTQSLASGEDCPAPQLLEELIGEAYFFKRRFDEATSKLLLAIQESPGAPIAYRFLAACYAHMGQLHEARAVVARLRAITPLVVPSDLPYRKPEDRELLLAGLRLAMGETG